MYRKTPQSGCILGCEGEINAVFRLYVTKREIALFDIGAGENVLAP